MAPGKSHPSPNSLPGTVRRQRYDEGTSMCHRAWHHKWLALVGSQHRRIIKEKRITYTLGWHLHAKYPCAFHFCLGTRWGLAQATFAWQCTGPPMRTLHLGEFVLRTQNTSMCPSTCELTSTGQEEGHATFYAKRAFRPTSIQACWGSQDGHCHHTVAKLGLHKGMGQLVC